MNSLQWDDECLLGYRPMDEIHEEFVLLVGRMQAAPDAELPSLLEALARHLEVHFDMENAWMNETEFPPRDCHIDEHAAVLASVRAVQGLLAQGDVAICRALVDQLASWFPSHAAHLDSALAHWMVKRRLGGKPVVLRRRINPR